MRACFLVMGFLLGHFGSYRVLFGLFFQLLEECPPFLMGMKRPFPRWILAIDKFKGRHSNG
jgi:hypothetical protein